MNKAYIQRCIALLRDLPQDPNWTRDEEEALRDIIGLADDIVHGPSFKAGTLIDGKPGLCGHMPLPDRFSGRQVAMYPITEPEK